MSAGPRAPSMLVPCLAGAAQALLFINHAPLLPLIMRDLAITPAAAGLLSTATFLGAGVLAVPTGRLSDRLGARHVMALSLLVSALSTLALAVAPGYATLLAVRLLSSVSVIATFVAGGAYINTLWRGQDQFMAQGFYGGAMQFGTGAAIFALPYAASRLGWRGALAACAAPVAAALLVWALCARDQRMALPGGSIRAVMGDPTVWRLGLINAAMFGLSIVLGTWMAVYFVHEFGVPLTTAGTLGSLSIVLGVLTRPAGGALIARGAIEPRRLIALTLAGNVLALLVLAVPRRPLGIAVAGVVLIGLSASLAYAAVITLTGQAQPAAAGAALGVLSVCSTSTIVVGAPLAGALLSASGHFTWPFVVLAGLPAAALWTARRLPAATPPARAAALSAAPPSRRTS